MRLSSVGGQQRVSTPREALPCTLQSGLCIAGVYLIIFCKGEISHIPLGLHLTKPYSPSARCNVHSGSPPPGLIKFSTLGHSMYTYSMAWKVVGRGEEGGPVPCPLNPEQLRLTPYELFEMLRIYKKRYCEFFRFREDIRLQSSRSHLFREYLPENESFSKTIFACSSGVQVGGIQVF